ncbi:MAG: amidohydrolase family protein [Pseudomonadota bacterium]
MRKDHALSVQEAVRKLSALPADTLSLPDRGRLKVGAFADVVVFDPASIEDHATFAKPHQLATGVRYVVVNGQLALREGEPTGAPTGRFVRGRAAKAAGGACRSAASDWSWPGSRK